MSDFRGGLARDLVDFGLFQAPPGRLRPIFGPIRYEFEVNLHCRGQARHYFDTIVTFLLLISGSSSLHVTW